MNGLKLFFHNAKYTMLSMFRLKVTLFWTLAFPLLPQPAIMLAAIIPVNNIHITFFFIFLILSFFNLQGVHPAVFFSFPFDSFYFTALM